MNVTFNTNSLNSNKQNYYNLNRQKTAFTANPASALADAAEQVVEQAAKDKSSFFAPFSKFYNNFTDGIAKHFTSKLVDSKPLGYVADKLKNSNNLFQHCMTIGSMITSGLYMQKTLTNDKLEKDRKNTLAVNQGLTFLVSTAGAYSLDKYLKIWWDDVTAKYVGLQLQDKNFEKDYKDIKAAINKVNKGLKNDAKANVNKLAETAKSELKMSETASTLFDRNIKKAVQNSKKIPELSKELSSRIKGMGLLRSMLVFGFVYRYFVPVVVTKPANLLCEKYLAHKKSKSEEKNKSEKLS